MPMKKLPMLMLALALVSFTIAAILTASLRTESVPTAAPVEREDPVRRFRTDREQLRAMEKAQLNDIIHDADTDPKIAAEAQARLMELCGSEEKELTLEGVLSMRGFGEPVVTVRGDSVNVIVPAETLTRQESAVILELVCRECDVDSGNVKIIPVAQNGN